jgi:NADH-quinone oxidoreductase subunit M
MPDGFPILSLIAFTPLIGVLILLFVPKEKGNLIKWIGIATTFIPLILCAWLYASFNLQDGAAQFAEKATWINAALNKELVERTGAIVSYSFQFNYSLAVDGISLPLVFLTALVSTMAALASVHIKKRWKTYFILFLLLEMSVLGVFLARDLFLFFLFFEITIVPTFFLVGIFGYNERERAANRFLVYNGIGSALMLVGFLTLIATAGMTIGQSDTGVTLMYSGAYDVILDNLSRPDALANIGREISPGFENPFYLTEGLKTGLFFLLLIAFGIKLPIFPFHTWMLKVHTEAAPATVMIHSGLLLKMGAYGLLRFGVLLLPNQTKEWAVLLAILGVINILYGAALAFVQKDFKLVLAYSSISHMGIVLLGLASLNGTGVQGAIFQLVSHGLISALLFLIVGSLYERTGTTNLDALGGLAKSMPFMCGILLTAGMASLGLPGMSGFVSEFLALLGLFNVMPILTAIGCLGIILAAVYVLRGVLKITYGPIRAESLQYKDARLVEAAPMIALVAFILLIGIYPAVLSEPLQATLGNFDHVLQGIQAKVGG